MGPKPQTMPTIAQMIFFGVAMSSRTIKLIHISTSATGWRTIEIRISRKSFS